MFATKTSPWREGAEMLKRLATELGPELSCTELLAFLAVLVLLLRFVA
jgi:hypothetical protein